MIAVQRPYSFLMLALLIPITIFIVIRYKKVSKSFGVMYLKDSSFGKNVYKNYRQALVLRTLFRLFACVSIIFAFAGISFGRTLVPVQKSGDAVCFVFDISYSMMAKDCPGGISRLEAEKQYAFSLLERMEGNSVSVVLAKGDGIIAVPLTDDRAGIDSIIESLSPSLMSSVGSSLGSGIRAGINSFPKNISQAAHIWVFTDGDETDNSLRSALDDAARFGYSVTMIGFGTSKPVEIISGDGKTKVKTFLNAEKMIDMAALAGQRISFPEKKRSSFTGISYLAADSEGSAHVLLSQLSSNALIRETYDVQSVPRHKFFILLTILFFLASYFVSEFDLSSIVKSKNIGFVLLVCSCQFFISCKSDRATVLSGTFSWYQKKYQSATASFLRALNWAEQKNDETLKDYCAYNLASTYIMQDEYTAALERLEQVSPNAPSKLKSAVFYNLGIIANSKGDYKNARDFFKKAIVADFSNTDAKLNLEFTEHIVESKKSQQVEKQMSQASLNQDTPLSDAVFNLIQQEETERWKKLQSNKKSSSVDY
ncbi:VWA domain-containing protein [Treponema pectinovorum]|uniref:VWA domain-containing protein n=1 Tax=Treponema pectinovorum TaxID=164 RepID=UPI003D8E7046